MFRTVAINLSRVLLLSSSISLIACNGSGDGSTQQDVTQAESQLFIAGGGIKGPLAFANVELYALDTRFDELYEPGNPIAAATTNAYAEITGLPVPGDILPPYVLVIDGSNAIDRNTNEAPVTKKLVTIITEQSLAAGQPVYATPYTTLAYHMLTRDPHGNGLHATYFNDVSLSSVALERTDSVVNFNWQAGSPDAAVNADRFSVRWKGMIKPAHPGNYTFYTSTDDGVRLWVDGELLVDRWTNQSVTEASGTIHLADGKHDIVMEYYENGGLASAKLSWSGPNLPKTTIPARNLSTVVAPGYRTTDPEIGVRMTEYDQKIIRAISFGMPTDASIFDTPPIINGNTTTVESQQRVVQHRAAIEAFSALLHNMASSQPNITTDILLERLALDIHSDDLIDSTANGQTISGIDTGILSQNPMSVTIPNTAYRVRDIVSLIDGERALIGDSGSVFFYKNDMVVDLQAASLDANSTTVTSIGGSGENISTAIDNTSELSYSAPVGNLVNTLLASGLIASGPIVIDGEQDVVISGLRVTNPDGHCVVVKNGATNVVIENNEIGPCGMKGIDITNGSSHITVRNNHIHDTQNEAVMSYEAHDITVDSNVIVDVESGYEMWTTSVGNLSFTNNYVKNVTRRSSNGGNIAMAAFVRGGNIRINNNIGINILDESRPEDLINIFKSSGKPDDPIQIRNNRFKGGGPAMAGGGIILGDQGGSYQLVENNILVNPGGYGLAIAGGDHHVIRNNKVYSDGQHDFANVGVFVWRFNHNGNGTSPGDCHDHTVADNDITFWQGPNYKGSGLPSSLNASWVPNYGADGLEPNCGSVAGWGTNRFDTSDSQPANLGMSLWNSAWDNP